MKNIFKPAVFVLFCGVFCACFFAVFPAESDAARLGGGRSFGSGSSYGRSAPAPQPSRPAQQDYYQTSRQQQTAPVPGPASGGFGGKGLLGGLLAGTLLGSMLGGGPSGGAGFLDILLIGFMIYFGLKIFSRLRRPAPAGSGNGGVSADPWGHLKSAPQGGAGTGANGGGFASAGPKLPPDFDREDFIKGAKAMFMRLQSAWDVRDFDDLGKFVTPGMLEEIRKQAEEDREPGKTEVLMLDADLVDWRTDKAEGGERELAGVYFQALMQETLEDGTIQARELWTFCRDAGKNGSLWRLDGIQQVE